VQKGTPTYMGQEKQTEKTIQNKKAKSKQNKNLYIPRLSDQTDFLRRQAYPLWIDFPPLTI